MVEIALVDNESGFANIKAILKHHGNDEQDYVFIYVAWFEDLSRQDELISCPIYQLQKDSSHTYYCIHPISTVKPKLEVLFVHHYDSDALQIITNFQIMNIFKITFYFRQYNNYRQNIIISIAIFTHILLI